MRARLVLLALAVLETAAGCSPRHGVPFVHEAEAGGFPWARRAGAAAAALSIKQTPVAFDCSGPGTSCDITFGSALTAGSAVSLLVRSETLSTAASDTSSNSYVHHVNWTGGGQYLDSWDACNVASGSPTITITKTAAYTAFGGVAYEIGGAAASGCVETSNTYTVGGYTQDRYTGSVTCAGACVTLGWPIDANSGLDDASYGLTPDAGYTRRPYINSWVNLGSMDKIQTAGTYNPHGLTTAAYSANAGATIAIK